MNAIAQMLSIQQVFGIGGGSWQVSYVMRGGGGV